jgi:hypothetical protein
MSISAISGSSTLQVSSDTTTVPSKTTSADAAPSAKGDTVQISSGSLASSKSTASTSSTKVYDKMDTNKDGTVSIQEELAYEMAHPKVDDAASKTASGKDQEKTGEQTKEKTGIETYA